MSWLWHTLLALAPLPAQGKLVHLEAPPLVRQGSAPPHPFRLAAAGDG